MSECLMHNMMVLQPARKMFNVWIMLASFCCCGDIRQQMCQAVLPLMMWQMMIDCRSPAQHVCHLQNTNKRMCILLSTFVTAQIDFKPINRNTVPLRQAKLAWSSQKQHRLFHQNLGGPICCDWKIRRAIIFCANKWVVCFRQWCCHLQRERKSPEHAAVADALHNNFYHCFKELSGCIFQQHTCFAELDQDLAIPFN